MEKVIEKDFYVNEAQLKCIMVSARVQVNLIGRAGGKSSFIIPKKTTKCMDLMPRGCGILLAPSYQKMLQDLVSPMVRGWQKLGYEENVDFVIGKEPPKNWDKPFLMPRDFKYCIAWRNGHLHRIVSQDKSVTSNGIEGHYLIGDEAKLLNGKKFVDETLPCLRGEAYLWEKLPEYGSIEFFSDMYFHKRGANWFLKMYEKFHNDEEVKIIYETAMLIEHLRNNDSANKMLPIFEEKLRIMRCNAIAIIKAPSTANRYVLGETYLKNMTQSMTVQEFKGAILTQEIFGGGDFYASFDVDIHGYIPPDMLSGGLSADLRRINEKDSSTDSDCDTNRKLEIAVDWGGKGNFMTIHQEKAKHFHKINELFTSKGSTYHELANKFCNYYRHHKCKEVDFHYDPSGNNTNANSVKTFAQEFAEILRSKGWRVIMCSLGKNNIAHSRKHRLWSAVLKERNGMCTDDRLKGYRVNRTNCPESIISMANAPLKVTKGAFEKDKSSERKDDTIAPQHATHFSDCDDIYMVAKQLHLIEERNDGFRA